MIDRARRNGQPYLIFHAQGLPDDKAIDRAVAALDGVERAKASRFRSTRDLRRFIWRRYMRRYLLAEALGVEPGELFFATACPRCGSREHGKPYLPNAPHLHFSAAQSGDHTSVATGPAPFGIDIQAHSPDLRDAADVFTQDELAELDRSVPEANQQRTVLWARKEAYLKALGLGLSLDPATVDAHASGFADGVFGQISAPGQPPWSIASWSLPEAIVAIACASPQVVRPVEIAAATDPRPPYG